MFPSAKLGREENKYDFSSELRTSSRWSNFIPDLVTMWPWSSSSNKADGAPTAQNDRSASTQSQSATDDLKRAAADLDSKKLPEREKLPPKLQSIIDKQEKEENFFDELVEG